jgi:hypothetical protein
MPKGTSDAGSATHRTPKLEGRVSAPDSAIRRWDRIALLLHYVINPARRLTTNIRLRALHLTGVDLRPTLQNPQVRPGFGPAAPTLAAGR